jgi:hypothetical protein
MFMHNKRLNAARDVAARLFAAEQAIDIAVTRIAELNAAMPAARLEANLSAIVGHAAFESGADALTFVTKAREQIITTHHRLRDAGDQIGLRTVSFGDSIKPPSASASGETPHLRVAS